MLTHWNKDYGTFEARIPYGMGLDMREEKGEMINNGVFTTPSQYYVSGFIVDALAKYEETGLTPFEINELKLKTLKNLKSSNEKLQKMNDELSDSYNRLLQENHKLKCLLRDYLNSVT